jgi:hypothetical protein
VLVGQYFVCVGTVLWTLLLIANLCLPSAPPAVSHELTLSEKLHIRLLSDKTWPEKIVFDVRPSNPLGTGRTSVGTNSGMGREAGSFASLVRTR